MIRTQQGSISGATPLLQSGDRMYISRFGNNLLNTRKFMGMCWITFMPIMLELCAKSSSATHLKIYLLLLVSCFDAEDGGDMFLGNVG
jgi:hypothetical protein